MPKRTANKGSFKKGQSKGRPAGIPNKVTTAAKEAFGHAFEGMGGVEELIRWGRLNRTEFYKLYARLIPVDVTSDEKPLEATTIERTIIEKKV